MKYHRLGRSNLRVSPLCLGTMMFGEQTPFDEAAAIVASARDHGLNFIDTADVYNGGRSEETLARLLDGQRHDWVLASKIGNAVGKGANLAHYSRKWMIQGVEQSLARLGTDYMDILYLHRDYPGENLEEAIRAVDDLIRAGKLRYFGLSNFRGWRIAEVVRLCEQLGAPLPVVHQPCYNLLNREPEVEVLPACGHYGLGVVPYSPIARGVLTGKYQTGQAPAPDSRAGRGDKRIMDTEFRPESLEIARRLAAHCEPRGIRPEHFATAWVLANPFVTSVIAGPRTLAQMEGYYAALDVVISAEDEDMVDGWVPPGHFSTHGFIDPNYPIQGRPRAMREG